MKNNPSNIPVNKLTLAEFSKNNIKKIVYKSVYNEKRDCSNRTFISYYTSHNTRKEIPLRNINSRKEAIEYAYKYECSTIEKEKNIACTREIFSLTDRYGNTDYFMCQHLPNSEPFYFVQKGKYKTTSIETANRDIDVIIEYYANGLRINSEIPPSAKQENVIEIYNYFNDLEKQFLKHIIEYKISLKAA